MVWFFKYAYERKKYYISVISSRLFHQGIITITLIIIIIIIKLLSYLDFAGMIPTVEIRIKGEKESEKDKSDK